jgi:hAT family C-terminal dimerisation region
MFSILASMTYDIFVVSVSTVASESYFNTANMVLTDKRIRLSENVFEALVLLKGLVRYKKQTSRQVWDALS